jgi:deazaflavin-dependent oxidoreductase (nitroreductase family)
MGNRKRGLTRIGNRFGAWIYRTFDGRVMSGKRNTVLMITAPGRRTGIPRSTCVRYLDHAGGFLVWGTGSGSRQDPDWFRNVRAADEADVQVMSQHIRVRPRELLGAERDTAWNDVVLATVPAVAKYAQRAGRTIPVALLQPLERGLTSSQRDIS